MFTLMLNNRVTGQKIDKRQLFSILKKHYNENDFVAQKADVPVILQRLSLAKEDAMLSLKMKT